MSESQKRVKDPVIYPWWRFSAKIKAVNKFRKKKPHQRFSTGTWIRLWNWFLYKKFIAPKLVEKLTIWESVRRDHKKHQAECECLDLSHRLFKKTSINSQYKLEKLNFFHHLINHELIILTFYILDSFSIFLEFWWSFNFCKINPLSANPTKCSNTLKTIRRLLPKNWVVWTFCRVDA